MTIAERHKYILDELKRNGFVSVADLSKDLDVTMVTIRKDLKILEDKGLLYRSHGSATPASPYVNDRSVSEKKLVRVEEKMKIAQAAIQMVEDDDAIIIGSGTTVVAFAQAIPKNKKLTVLTAAMNVTLALIDANAIEIVQLGGVVRKSSSSVVGHYAEEMLEQFACSKLFLSADGISLDYGLTTSHMMEAHLNAQMMKGVQKTVVLADSSKFGKKGFGKICNLEDIDIIITDLGIPELYKGRLEEMGIAVLLV
ncbi:Transcriptional repressor of aga operon [Indibacter alkaliphilus LW1]|jgi:DeoR family transcriptional regulator of aga operon|uniref:Transcriptional repressor of aga operon n=1 Tax=Indibacter alkaliphilus (strain CCUG 57479 / KCTC 22604 / LW1) TaxID=1189612 RepID=S2E533_INDAL|nr:DeoR/GlpR family DNA-binding transcription regulator [Indibacter alkaliphilus]EOZ99701.1 Transcriptional repressor of aga operon [Indibacter alkaliphilus LW1]